MGRQTRNMRAMDADEREICEFLKSWNGKFVSWREIARRAGGKWRYREDPYWSKPVLLRLVEQGILESDAAGHYRIRQKEEPKQKKWVSPQIKAILEKRGKDFGDVQDVDASDDLGN